MEENNKKMNWDMIRWALLFVLILILAYQFWGNQQTPNAGQNQQVTPQINDYPEGSDVMAAPQVNPEAVMAEPTGRNAYTPNSEFERLMVANKNKTDFDFSFENFEETPIYDLKDGKIDFALKGNLKTKQNLKGKVTLAIEFFATDQVSFARRVASRAFDLPYVNISAEKDKDGRYQYDFDFKKSFTLNKGLYYFTIIPQGRNRVMYTNKFEVR